MHPLDDVPALMALEGIEENYFRGKSTPTKVRKRIFGGQVAAQALAAAYRTVTDRDVHSLHGYFLRPGDPQIPILFHVDRIRDGGSFTTRRVVAIQHGQAIFNMAASFHKEDSGFEHQVTMPEVPAPETLTSQEEYDAALAARFPDRFMDLRPPPIEQRLVTPFDRFNFVPQDGPLIMWIRYRKPLPDDPILHRCVLTYASDLMLLNSSLRRHGSGWADPRVQCASLDHALWFHRPCNTNEWLLYMQDSPAAGSGRGLNFGSVFTREGVLVASVAQEGLIRFVAPQGERKS